MSITQILIQAIAGLVLGIGVFVALACTLGAAMIFDSWIEESIDDANTSK